MIMTDDEPRPLLVMWLEGRWTMVDEADRRETTSGPYWLVEVDSEKCSVCEVCAHACSCGAIRSDQTGEKLVIIFRYELCDGCKECVQRCPEQAMILEPTRSPPDHKDGVILASSDLLMCSVCGTQFAPLSKLQAAAKKRGDDAALVREQCPLCRRTQMVARLIEEKREAKGRKAEYRTGQKWSWKPVVEGDRDAPPCMDVLREKSESEAPAPPPVDEDPLAKQ
jgi:Pyruvate/2-oxoacid:ferredoxin oxidoreductase delta subunit